MHQWWCLSTELPKAQKFYPACVVLAAASLTDALIDTQDSDALPWRFLIVKVNLCTGVWTVSFSVIPNTSLILMKTALQIKLTNNTSFL